MLLTLSTQNTAIPIRDPFLVSEIQVFSRLFPNSMKLVRMNKILFFLLYIIAKQQVFTFIDIKTLKKTVKPHSVRTKSFRQWQSIQKCLLSRVRHKEMFFFELGLITFLI